MKILRVTLISSLLLSLAGCGFSLRGNDVLSTKFTVLHLQLQQPGSEFSRILRSSLENSSININPAPAELQLQDLLTLVTSDEQIASRPITVNLRARAAQYELRLSVNIALLRENQYLIDPETVFIERSYFEDIANINGSQEEIAIITAEMRHELVNQIMRRLEAVAI